MLNARTLLTPLAGVLAVAALAAVPTPAQAWVPPAPAATGGAKLLESHGDVGVAPGGTPAWPGDAEPAPVPGVSLVPDLLDLLPELQQPPPEPLLPATTTMIAGKVARLRTDGRAAIPRGAPKRVRRLIAQYNRIVGKRYKWGGGHAVVEDVAYDCSGAVGYGLIRTGMLDTTMVSGSFTRWAAAGPGRWVTIYASRTHVYTELAGLRLDTSPYGDLYGGDGVRWRAVVGARSGFKVRHPVGL